MRLRHLTIPLPLLLSLLPHYLSAQTPTANDTYHLQVDKQAVVLDVVVTDKNGNTVTNLREEDFGVFDDKVLQNISSFDPPSPSSARGPEVHSTAELDRLEPNAPVTIIVLDEINTRFEDEAFARYSLKQFLDKQGDTLEHPTLLGAVDLYRFTPLRDYTTSKQELLVALDKHFTANPWYLQGTSWKAQQYIASFSALLEISQATAGHLGHKSLLWVGRGFPAFDPTTLSVQDSEGLTQVIEACTNAMRTSRIVLYTLDPAGVTTEASTLDSDGFPTDLLQGELDFPKMAEATGGHAFYGHNDVDQLVAESSREGAKFYTLSYTPTIPKDDTHDFHNIRVVMKDPNLKAETREGYYAHPPAPTPGVGSKKADQKVFDLGLAAQSTLVYDGIHFTVKRSTTDPNQFDIIINSGDLVWRESGGQKLTTKITVVAVSFNKKNELVDHTVKLSVLQVGEGQIVASPVDPTVHLYATVSTKSSATRVRILVRSEDTNKLGAQNLELGTTQKK